MTAAPSTPVPDDSEQAGIGTLNYTDLPGLEDVFLEDSFVREIVETSAFVSFTLLAVLTPAHPAYQPAERLENYCFRNATLTFPKPRKVTWHGRGADRFVDVAGATDLGNIDRFVASAPGYYRLEGDFGVVDIVSLAPQLDLLAIELPTRRQVELVAWIAGQTPPPEAHDHAGHDHDAGHAH